MPKRPSLTRTTLDTGIYRDAHGLEARVTVNGKQTVQRFDLDTPLDTVRRWRLDARADLRIAPLTPDQPITPPAGAPLEARMDAFFPQIAGRVSFKADRSHLRAWIGARGADGQTLGSKPPEAITTADVNVVISAWRTPPPAGSPGQVRAVRRITVTAYARDGHTIDRYERKTPTTSASLVVAVRTVRHRCRLLREFFVAEGVPTIAIDAAHIPKLERGVPLGVDIETIRDVAHALATSDWSDTYGRYLVLVATGQRPTQLMRAEPSDVKLERRLWIVRSAKGAPAHTITLNAEMVKAWRVFIKANAWGVYDTSLHAKRLRVCGWPAAIRPYNARHAVAQDALQVHDVDLGDVQGLLGHTTPTTTRRSYGPLAIDRQRHVSDQLNGRLKGVFGPRLVKRAKGGA